MTSWCICTVLWRPKGHFVEVSHPKWSFVGSRVTLSAEAVCRISPNDCAGSSSQTSIMPPAPACPINALPGGSRPSSLYGQTTPLSRQHEVGWYSNRDNEENQERTDPRAYDLFNVGIALQHGAVQVLLKMQSNANRIDACFVSICKIPLPFLPRKPSLSPYGPVDQLGEFGEFGELGEFGEFGEFGEGRGTFGGVLSDLP